MSRRIDFAQVASRLRAFYFRHQHLPSFSELQVLFRYRSKGGVSVLVERLLQKGIVKRSTKGRIIPGRCFQPGLKLVGSIEAGFPSPAEEELIDTVSLDEFLIQKPEATYLVKVTGDSMQGAGIMPGDLVLVERGKNPVSGDIVIAQVDGQWTMKYFQKRNGKVVLEAANKKYPVIFPKEELVIGGVVIANIRKYR